MVKWLIGSGFEYLYELFLFLRFSVLKQFSKFIWQRTSFFDTYSDFLVIRSFFHQYISNELFFHELVIGILRFSREAKSNHFLQMLMILIVWLCLPKLVSPFFRHLGFFRIQKSQSLKFWVEIRNVFCSIIPHIKLKLRVQSILFSCHVPCHSSWKKKQENSLDSIFQSHSTINISTTAFWTSCHYQLIKAPKQSTKSDLISRISLVK